MEQSLQGVSFPQAAAAKAELLHHNHDTTKPCSTCSPNPWKRKGIARPWMGYGVGEGKEALKLQDQMMKRKRDGGAASTVSVTSVSASDSTPKSCEKFELDFLRHDGHFCSDQGHKKGRVCTFVKQYFRQKWLENGPETQPMSKVKRLQYAKSKEAQPWSRSKRLGHASIEGGPKQGIKSKRLEYHTVKEETQMVGIGKILEYLPAKEEIPSMSNKNSLEYTTTRDGETQPLSKNKNLEYEIATKETQRVNVSKSLAYTKTPQESQSMTKSFEFTPSLDETKPVRRRKSLEYPTTREKLDVASKSNRLEIVTAEEETKTASKSSDHVQNEEVDVESPTSTSSKTKWGLPCGTDCNQVRTEIFRKTNSLMRRKPDILHIKSRPKHSTSSDEDEEPRPVATEHQAVQTIFTENKKVQTSFHEPKQVQWAILPRDTLSPKVPRLVNEVQSQPYEMQYFRDDTFLMKVSVEQTHEVPTKDELHFNREIVNCGRGMELQVDSPYLDVGKRHRVPHHLLLYQEALDIAKEQRDLERAREERRDFWTVYEQELKRGRGWHGEESKIERKGKWTTEEEERSSFGEEVSAPGKSKFNAFVDEHLNLGSTTPVSSSTKDESGSSQEAATIFKQLLDKVESYETSPKGNDLVGLQGLRKIQETDNLQSLEAIEQQLNLEASQPTTQFSPTELDCMKSAILSHSFYPRLVSSFINQHKAGAPPDQVERLEKIKSQVMESWRPSGSPVTKPAHEEKIKKYQDILTKFERELEKPFQDAMDFSWHMEHYLDVVPSSKGRSGIGSSGGPNLKDFNGE